MKETVLERFAMTALAVSLLACTGGKTPGSTNDSGDSARVSQQAPGEVPDGGQEEDGRYLSPDLMMDELQGRVKMCTLKQASCNQDGEVDKTAYWMETTKVYGQDGFLALQDKAMNWRLSDPKIERNDKQQVTKVSWYISDYNTDVQEVYTYYDNGMVKSCKSLGIENEDETQYFYDADRMLQKTLSHGAGEGTIFRTTTTYTILDTDEQGNWTRRILKQTIEDGPDDGRGSYENSIDEYSIQLRDIVYW